MKNLLDKILKGYVVLEITESPINEKIEVREDILGRRTLVAGGLAQSGKEVKRIWQKAIKQVQTINLPRGKAGNKVQRCLILGLGAGTVAKLISRRLPDAKITGIEIDPEIIKLGKKYFGLDSIKNLEIKIGDAISVVSNGTMKQCNNYDLILVDLYLGDEYPPKAEDQSFFKSIKCQLSKDGLIVVNRLYYHMSDKQQTDEFGKKLKGIFNRIEEAEISWNKFFFCFDSTWGVE